MTIDEAISAEWKEGDIEKGVWADYHDTQMEIFARRVTERVLKEIIEWLDERIKFAENEKKNDDSNQDSFGERYWHGVIVGYMGAKQKLLNDYLEKEQK